MFERLVGAGFYPKVRVFGLLLIAVGLPWTKILMSLGVMILLLGFLLPGRFGEVLSNWKRNKVLLWLVLILVLQLLSFSWSSDLDYGLWDLRVKLPMYLIPLLVAGRSFPENRHVKLILYGFLTSLLVTSLINYASYNQLFGEREVRDIRDLSLFGSHIRYALCVAMGLSILLWEMKERKQWFFLLLPALWLVYYTYYSQVLSGILALGLVFFIVVLFLLRRQSKWYLYSFLGFCILFLFAVIKVILPAQQQDYKLQELPATTKYGKPYEHHFFEYSANNGESVFAFYSEEELSEAWNSASQLDYYGKDKKGQVLFATLCRYMTSLGLTKDKAGFRELTKEDIENVERGMTSYAEAKGGLRARIHDIRYELKYTDDPNGHSLLQRREYWRTGIYIIARNVVFGVGAGDVQLAFDQAYIETDSKLIAEKRLRAHNQFLTYWISLGIAGIILFCALLIHFFVACLRSRQLLGIVFICIFALSCLFEDTLETQVGVTFFGFFFALLIRKQN